MCGCSSAAASRDSRRKRSRKRSSRASSGQQHLQRHAPLERDVLGRVDRAGRAATDQRLDPIARQGHSVPELRHHATLHPRAAAVKRRRLRSLGMDETFLDALTEDEAADLHAAGRRRSYGANTTLFHEGDDAGPVVVLLAGRAKVATIGGAGREAIMAVRGPGDLIGELSAIDGGPRSGTVTTLEPAEALLVPGSAFAGLLERRPRIALVILRMVAGRLRYADSQQAQFATHDVVGPRGAAARRAGRALRRARRRPDRDRAAALAGGARVAGPAPRARPSARRSSSCGRSTSSRPAGATSPCSTRRRCAQRAR